MGLSIRDMAEALGVSKSQVGRDKDAGMPMDSADAARAWRLADKDPSRTVDGRIDRPHAQTPASDSPRSDAEAGTAAGPAGETTSPAGSADDDQVDVDTAAYRADRARNERIKADRAELELEQLRGELVLVKEVERLEFTAGRIVRDRVLMVPARVAGSLQALVLSLAPDDELRADVAKRLTTHTIERLLEDALRGALLEAKKAIEEARNDDDDDASG